MITSRHVLSRVPAHILNGASVSLGVTLIYLVGVGLGSGHAGLSAASGAVYASLADVPNPPARSWRRVLTAALIGTLVSFVVGALRSHPLALGATITVIGFLSALTLAWGLRAGPISFVGVMSFVFTMAARPLPNLAAVLVPVGWVAAGGALYVLWAWFTAVLLAPRYRALALATVLAQTARLMRMRAQLLAGAAAAPAGAAPEKAWIALDSALDESLQAARDQLFAARAGAAAARQTALLLLAIDLRDTLLLGQLDLDILGDDAAGRRVRREVAQHYERIASALAGLEASVRGAAPAPAAEPLPQPVFDGAGIVPGDLRARLLPVLVNRMRHLAEDLARMQSTCAGAAPGEPLTRAQLQLFVSVEGWPLAALRPHRGLGSAVLRHALRASAALGAAYFIGLSLPWASHPHWLVLSVAVVLRGTLEQTLLRRNLRVAGTVLGCLVVMALSHLATPWLSTAVYLGATGLAHAFSVARYFVTATAATVMALLQDHLANPTGGFAVVERLADTAIGALLAWAFSYVLPSWERIGLPRLLARQLRALDALAGEALRLPDAAAGDIALRLARREVYESLRALAAAGQRSRVEPRSVRVPAQAFADLLAHSHAFLGHVASVRVLLARRSSELEAGPTRDALAQARARIGTELARRDAAPAAPADADLLLAELPSEAPARDLMPWLERRLQLACREAAEAARAAAALRVSARP
jgi:uncharacterized membrane protein YccC